MAAVIHSAFSEHFKVKFPKPCIYAKNQLYGILHIKIGKIANKIRKKLKAITCT